MTETPSEDPLDDLSGDGPATFVSRLHSSLILFTESIGSVLDVCSYGLTVGEAYVPFDPDPEDECDEEDAICSQVWVRVDSSSFPSTLDSWEDGCGGELTLDLEVGVLRCVEVPEGGEAPSAADVLTAALQAMDDMNTIHCAAMENGGDGVDELWTSIESQQWFPSGPMGGQVGGIWRFTVTF